MKSSVEAFKLAGGLFIIPIMMAYTNLVSPDAGVLALGVSILQTLAIIVAIAISIEGYFITKLNAIERGLAVLTIPTLLINPFNMAFVGVLIMIGLLLFQMRRK